MEVARAEVDAVAIRRRKIRKRRIITVIALVVVVAVLAVLYAGRSRKSDNTNVVTARVGTATIVEKISATGSITPQTGAQVSIGSQVTGRIKVLYADVGSHVSAGQVIAELDLPDVRAQYNSAVASLHSARLNAQQQQSGVGLQRTTTSSGISKAQADLATATATYNQAVQSAKLQVNASEAAVTQARASARNAQTFLQREQQLLAKGYVAAQDVDNAQTQADVAAAQLDSAQQNLTLTESTSATNVQTAQNAVKDARAALASANAGTAQNTIKQQQVAGARSAVDQAQAQVEYWQAQYNKTVIRTPISGTVITLDAQQGETVAAGLAAPTLIKVTDLNRLQVDAFVDETDIGNVHLGQPATVTVDAYPNMQFQGRVVKIASGGTLQQNVVTYDTTISLSNPEGLLKPDMTATTQIVVATHKDVIAVPIEAVQIQKTGAVVNVLQGGKVVPRAVVTGVSDDTMTEIRSGLRRDDTIVLAGGQPAGGFGGGARMTPFGPSGGGRPSGGPPGGR